MKSRNLLLAVICLAALLSGCATNEVSKPLCLVLGSAVGAGIGAAADDDDPKVIAAGAVVGSIVGFLVCGQDKDSDGDGVMDSKDKCPGTAKGVAVDSNGCPLDSDGDGVNDSKDRCPDTPRGTAVNTSGCPLDSDGDGVTDDKDRCPRTPAGAAVNKHGCQLDGDGDGVYDNMDECPNTPKGQAVNKKGCHIVFSLEGVNFALNSASLTQEAMDKLKQAEKMLRANPDRKVRVEGHTDSAGETSYNQQLSQRRAESVVKYLRSKGIDAGRMTAKGYGESSPVADNTTREGRARNRRVDFVIAD